MIKPKIATPVPSSPATAEYHGRRAPSGGNGADIGRDKGRDAPEAERHRQHHQKRADQARPHAFVEEHVVTVKRVSAACSAASSAPLACIARTSRGFSAASSQRAEFRHAAPNPQYEQSREHADEIHPAPSIGAEPADYQPHAGGEDAADPGARLQQTAALAAGVVGPQFRDDRGARSPIPSRSRPRPKSARSRTIPNSRRSR